MNPPLPRVPGTYALVLYNRARAVIQTGKLGRFSFARGWYVYTGSAFGPGGLGARVGRHLTPHKSLRWHIDYLTCQMPVKRVWICRKPICLECSWAHILEQMGGTPPVPGFGSSDCKCASHLFYFSTRPLVTPFRKKANDPVQIFRTDPATARS